MLRFRFSKHATSTRGDKVDVPRSSVREYVLGFAFDSVEYAHARVALIRKNRPAWQAGRLNGIGGKVEREDRARHGAIYNAMVREFFEETSYRSKTQAWTHYLTYRGKGYDLYVFSMFLDYQDFDTLRTNTDEEIISVPARYLPETVIHNLRWRIPLAFDSDYRGVARVSGL